MAIPAQPAPPGTDSAADMDLSAGILASLPLGIMATDPEGRLRYLNEHARQLLDPAGAEVIGQPLATLLQPLLAGGQNAAELTQRLLGGHVSVRLVLTARGNGRETREMEIRSTPWLDAAGGNLGTTLTIASPTETAVSPVTPRPDSVDPLTGLLGRRAFERRLEILIMDAATSSRTHALLLMDMDQFKLINDLSGHHAGDVLLQQIAELLLGEIHKGDTLARLGGDEFALLLSNIEAAEAVSVARRLMAAVQSKPFTWDGRAYPQSASIGIVPITEETRHTSVALSRADTALYAAKDQGRNRLHIYESSDSELARRHGEMEWVARINRALECGLFRLVTQQIAPLQHAEQGAHFEVLLRMLHDGQLISPAEFIAAAERFGIMGRVDRWVIGTFLDYLKRHPEPPGSPTLCTLNISGQSLLDEGFLPFVRQQIDRPGINPANLCFEVTETATISNFQQAQHFIEEIHALGCQFALDDFGSGMSSFGYLRQLPVDYLKIDGVFVRDLDADPVHCAMVKSINEIGHAMGKKTIAEFVGNEHIMRILKEMGVDYGQGYHIGEPQLLALAA